MKKVLSVLSLAVLAMLAGCAAWSQAVDAYGAAAVTGARAANDTALKATKVALCATPVSALARNPEFIPAIKSLCLAPGDKTTADVLDAVQKGGS